MSIVDLLKKGNVDDGNLSEERRERVDEYFEKLYDLWLCIVFCIAGWIVACIGFAMIASNDLGILLVVIGVVIVDLPCYKILLAGGSLGSIIGASVGASRIIHYSDGTKRRDDSAWSAGLAASIFTWLATLVVGVFAIVIRIFKDFIACMSIKKNEDIKTDIKAAAWLPIAVGLAVFVLGIIISSAAGAAIEHNAIWQDDFDDKTSIEMLDKVVAGMESIDFSYSAIMVDTPEREKVSVSYAAPDEGATKGTYAVTVPESVATHLGITAATYYNEGAGWYRDMFEKAPVTEASALAFLEKCTIKGMLAYDTLVADVKNLTVYDRKYDPSTYFDVVYRFYYHVEAEHGYEMRFDAGYKDDQWRIRMVENPFDWEIYDYVSLYD